MRRRALLALAAGTLVVLAGCSGGDGGGGAGSGGSGGISGGGGAGGSGGTGGGCPSGDGVPAARSATDGVFVASGHQFVVFGGDTQTTAGQAALYDDTLWVYDTACRVWLKPSPATNPGPRGDYAAALDTTRNRILYVGGRTGSSPSFSLLNDVWAYDLTGGSFAQLFPVGGGPDKREGLRAVYDATKDRLLVFGGNKSTFFGTELLDDLWELKFGSGDGTWRKITASGGPSAREDVGMAFHPGLGVVGVFGGCVNSDCRRTTSGGTQHASSGEFFLFDVATDTWSRPTIMNDSNPRLDESHPSERYWAELMPVTLPGTTASIDGFVLFGGFDDFVQHWRNDLWEILINSIKTQATYKAAWFGDRTAGADLTAPERRYAHAAAIDGTAVWMAGGSTACGAIDDVWSFDLVNPSPGPCPPGVQACWYAASRPTTGLTCEHRKTGNQVCDMADVCGDPHAP